VSALSLRLGAVVLWSKMRLQPAVLLRQGG
jgi:hypothetical protein